MVTPDQQSPEESQGVQWSKNCDNNNKNGNNSPNVSELSSA